ncbi:MAG: NAD(+)/NADH kinase [Eubacteriales bacterium]
MKAFCIITNCVKDPEYRITNQIKNLIEEEGAAAFIADEVDGKYNLPDGIDCIISLGGDGTLIRAAGDFHNEDIPLIGVNLGTLGYLTEIECTTLEEDIKILVNGNPILEERMMLQGQLRNVSGVALNDIVLARSGDIRIIRFRIYVNGSYLHSYKGDGIVVSTATGSTGYSMSAGGPIVEPTASIFIVTPICSHALNSRSIVLSSEDIIEIVLDEGREGIQDQASVSFDGASPVTIQTGERITITKANKTMKLMKLSKVSFLETLREKMAGN